MITSEQEVCVQETNKYKHIQIVTVDNEEYCQQNFPVKENHHLEVSMSLNGHFATRLVCTSLLRCGD